MKARLVVLPIMLVFILSITVPGQGARGALPSGSRHIVYGDVKVSQGQAGTEKPISLDLTLYNEYGNVIARQRIQRNGRYRFIDIQDGRYYIVIEFEGTEIDRFTVDFSSPYKSDLQKD